MHVVLQTGVIHVVMQTGVIQVVVQTGVIHEDAAAAAAASQEEESVVWCCILPSHHGLGGHLLLLQPCGGPATVLVYPLYALACEHFDGHLVPESLKTPSYKSGNRTCDFPWRSLL
jgi:hypothetical protein